MNESCALPDLYLQLDVKRRVVLSLRGVAALQSHLEATTGKASIFTGINWASPSRDEMLLILWAGLLVDDPGLALERVKEITQEVNDVALSAVVSAIVGRGLKIIEEKAFDRVNQKKKIMIQVTTLQPCFALVSLN